MPLSQYARDQALTYLFVGGAASLTTWYASLHTGFPGDTGTSILNEFTSGSDTSYARVQLTGGNALALTSHIIQNGGAVTWTAGGTWATATYLGLCTTSTAGDLLAYMELSQGGGITYFLAAAQFANPGSGYSVSDTLTLTSGGGAILTIDSVATVGGVTGVPVTYHISTHGSVSSIPANPMATTGGTGTGATVLASWLASPQAFQLNNGDSITFATSTILQAIG